MADGGGSASGVLGVLVGAMLVIFVGAAVLFGTGRLGGSGQGTSLTIKMPDAR
jgi:Sec-independent protein translocase protein TatA